MYHPVHVKALQQHSHNIKQMKDRYPVCLLNYMQNMDPCWFCRPSSLFLCSSDKQFLVFFFSRLRSNQSGRYEEDFPFLSLCGRERNFLRCDDRPVVFTHLLQTPTQPGQELLSYCGGAGKLSVPFRPEALYMHPVSGRLYHPCSERSGGVGLVRSALAIELSPFFVYAPEQGQSGQPTHFLWGGQKHTLTNELAGCFSSAEEGSGQHGELG